MCVNDDRGKIIHRDWKRIIIDFSSLRYERGITPTDIDMAIEFNGELFIVGEIKYKDTEVKKGQRIYIQRLIDAISRGGLPAIAFVAEHDIAPSMDRDIDAAMTRVREYYWKGKWRIPPHDSLVLADAIKQIREYAFRSSPQKKT